MTNIKVINERYFDAQILEMCSAKVGGNLILQYSKEVYSIQVPQNYNKCIPNFYKNTSSVHHLVRDLYVFKFKLDTIVNG